jgi:hypothetical protein
MDNILNIQKDPSYEDIDMLIRMTILEVCSIYSKSPCFQSSEEFENFYQIFPHDDYNELIHKYYLENVKDKETE